MQQALKYMDLKPGTPMRNISLDKIFIGSCTNSRIEDLRAAAAVVNGKKVARNIKLAMVVPGSGPGEGSGGDRKDSTRFSATPASNGARRDAPCVSP
jgi:hypothetical protein